MTKVDAAMSFALLAATLLAALALLPFREPDVAYPGTALVMLGLAALAVLFRRRRSEDGV